MNSFYKFCNKNFYVILNDFEYLIRKRYKEVILLIIIPILTLVAINIGINNTGIEILKATLGLNLGSNNFNVINAIVFVLNLIIQVYLLLCLYIKDIKEGLDNIFLRMSSNSWYLLKKVLYLIIVFLLKVIQYISIISIILFVKHSNFSFYDVCITFLMDYLFTVMIQQIVMLFYIIINVISQMKFITLGFAVLLMIMIPKNVMHYSKYYLALVLINIFLSVLSFLFYVNNKKQFIQNIGEI